MYNLMQLINRVTL